MSEPRSDLRIHIHPEGGRSYLILLEQLDNPQPGTGPIVGRIEYTSKAWQVSRLDRSRRFIKVLQNYPDMGQAVRFAAKHFRSRPELLDA